MTEDDLITKLSLENDRLVQELQLAKQTIQKLEAEKGTLLGENKNLENISRSLRNLMEQLKEQYLQEQVRVFNLEDVISILNKSSESERNCLNDQISVQSKEINKLKEQAVINVGQILKKTQTIAYTETLARNIFNVMFSMLSENKTSKKIKEFVGGTFTLKDLVELFILNTGLDLKYEDAECQALRNHVEKFDKLDSNSVDADRVTNMYQSLWLLSKVISHLKQI
jgi:hypothetical protein